MKEYTDFLQLASDRYSVRSFDGNPVSEEDLQKILRAGHLAPTARNLQPQKIILVSGEEALAKLRRCTRCHFNAPLALIVCYDKTLCWERGFDGKSSGDIDAAIVTTHMMLEATSLGLGSTWVMFYDPEAVRREFRLPDTLESTAILVIGHPAADAAPSANHDSFRKEEEIIVAGGY